MKNALILHGTDGHSGENWFPWLAEKLKEAGYHVWVPDLPGADIPNVGRYKDFVFPKWTFSGESIIVGHSSGAVAALGFLQELPDPIVIRAAYLVAGFLGDLSWDALREIGSYPFDWNNIRAKAEKFVLYHSDDDPYVPLEHGKTLARHLNGELIIRPGQKHFSLGTHPSYSVFPELLEKILE